LAVRQALGELQHRHQRQPRWRDRWATPGRKQLRELSVLEQFAERVTHPDRQAPFGNAAWATCAVIVGIAWLARGHIVISAASAVSSVDYAHVAQQIICS
jgi:hypothetical protein